MITDYKKLIKSTPTEVKYKDIVEIKRLAERVLAIDELHPNLIEVCEGYLEFCPDKEPASVEETVSWIWAIRPDLGPVILKHTLSTNMRLLIDAYQTNEMKKWWEYINEG